MTTNFKMIVIGDLFNINGKKGYSCEVRSWLQEKLDWSR